MGGRTEQSPHPQWVDCFSLLARDFARYMDRADGCVLPGGLTKLSDFPATAEQMHFGLYPDWLWASLASLVELGGSERRSESHEFAPLGPQPLKSLGA
jgi:hypothetical protein